MTGNELLWISGDIKDTADFDSAASDIELDRLGALLLSGKSGVEALTFLMPLATNDRDTILMRQKIIVDLLENPVLLSALNELSVLIADLKFYSEGVENNIQGLGVTKIDVAFDGLKKAIVRIEKNLSSQAAQIMEEIGSDNRYAQLLRAVLFRYELIGCYAKAFSLLRDAFNGLNLKSGALNVF